MPFHSTLLKHLFNTQKVFYFEGKTRQLLWDSDLLGWNEILSLASTICIKYHIHTSKLLKSLFQYQTLMYDYTCVGCKTYCPTGYLKDFIPFFIIVFFIFHGWSINLSTSIKLDLKCVSLAPTCLLLIIGSNQ